MEREWEWHEMKGYCKMTETDHLAGWECPQDYDRDYDCKDCEFWEWADSYEEAYYNGAR